MSHVPFCSLSTSYNSSGAMRKTEHINSAVRALERNDSSVGQNENRIKTDENGNRTENKRKRNRNDMELPATLYRRSMGTFLITTIHINLIDYYCITEKHLSNLW